MDGEQWFNLGIGAVLLAAGCYLLLNLKASGALIANYYRSQSESETAKGIWGKTLWLPGRRTSIAVAAIIALAALAVGGAAIGVAMSNI